jgi:AraC family transcriptional regulator
MAAAERISPEQWGLRLAAAPPPLLSLDGGLIRRWNGTSATMEQPPLDHHYLAQHLGGAKRVQRHGEGQSLDRTVELGSVTVVPAGSAYRWQTQGPIEFAHLYIAPRRLDRSIRETFDREPGHVELVPDIGATDPLVQALLTAILDPALDGKADSKMARDSWFEALLTRLIACGSTLATQTPRARNSLAPRTLARLKAYMTDNLASEISLDSLASVAGLSRFHLCRAFRASTGLPPHAWLNRARLARARNLLRSTDTPIHIIARQCGFASPNQFATCFRKAMGVTPSVFRHSG